MPLSIYFFALSFRLLNALITRSFFQPDEFYQSLELAHSFIFQFGYKTWEWRQSLDGVGGIRSPLSWIGFIPIYWILREFGLDDGIWLTLAPKFGQAFIAAWTDYSVYLLAGRVLGSKYSNAALFCSLSSFFNAYASTRTFSNSTETSLTITAINYWPLSGLKNENEKYSIILPLSLAALSCMIRPSNAIIWIILGIHLLIYSPNYRLRILLNTSIVGFLAIIICYQIDTAYYGISTFTPLNFLRQNVFNSISLFYGINSYHFYLSQGIPFLLITQLPFFLHGFLLSITDGGIEEGGLRWVIGGTIGIYSLLAHKEFRFINPLLPLFHLIVTKSLVKLYQPLPNSKSLLYNISNKLFIKPSHLALLLVSLIPAIYLTSFHSLAQVSIMTSIRNLPDLKSVAFFMPCHSTPWQSHLHLKGLEMQDGSGEGGRAWFITCEPPILGQIVEGYKDQSDFFYDDALAYLKNRFPPIVNPSFPSSPFTLPKPLSHSKFIQNTRHPDDLNWPHEWPSHIVLFESLLKIGVKSETIGDYLVKLGYQEILREWNSHFHEEKRSGDILILKWKE